MVLLPIDANCHCPFPTWFSLSFYRVLWNAVLEVRSRGIDLEGFLLQACNQCSLQQALVKALKLKNVTPYCPILRLARQIWQMASFGARQHCLSQSFCDVFSTSQNIHALQLSLLFCAFGSMAGQPRVECETCLPMKQLRDANLVANFVKILLNIIRAAVLPYFLEILLLPPFPMVWELLPGTDQRKHFSWWITIYARTIFWNWLMQFHALQFPFWLAHHPWSPPAISILNKVLMLLVKQAAAGFNASREIFQPSRNATLYDIDTPILSQLGIWFSNIFNDWEGNYCSWSNFVSLLVCPAPFALCSFLAFIPMNKYKQLIRLHGFQSFWIALTQFNPRRIQLGNKPWSIAWMAVHVLGFSLAPFKISDEWNVLQYIRRYPRSELLILSMFPQQTFT